MWHGISAYLLFVLLISLVWHAFSRRYVFSTVGAAALCSMLNLIHEAWLVDWQVNLGWGPPMFIVGWLLALPISALAGLPWLIYRSRREPSRNMRTISH